MAREDLAARSAAAALTSAAGWGTSQRYSATLECMCVEFANGHVNTGIPELFNECLHTTANLHSNIHR